MDRDRSCATLSAVLFGAATWSATAAIVFATPAISTLHISRENLAGIQLPDTTIGSVQSIAGSTLKCPESDLPQAKLNLVATTVSARCDTLDGVADGVFENPLRCKFDPSAAGLRPSTSTTTAVP
jgi:hypothetical protein